MNRQLPFIKIKSSTTPPPPFKIISSENIFLQESEPQSKEKQREKKKLDIEVDFREVGKDFFITLPN